MKIDVDASAPSPQIINMQVRIEKDVTRALRLAAVKADKSVPKFLNELLRRVLKKPNP